MLQLESRPVNNKLVYVGKGYQNPTIDRIVEVNVDIKDEVLKNTYTSFIMEDLIEYEREHRGDEEGIRKYSTFIAESYCIVAGSEINIRGYGSYDYEVEEQISANESKESLLRESSMDSGDQQDGRGDNQENTGNRSIEGTRTQKRL